MALKIKGEVTREVPSTREAKPRLIRSGRFETLKSSEPKEMTVIGEFMDHVNEQITALDHLIGRVGAIRDRLYGEPDGADHGNGSPEPNGHFGALRARLGAIDSRLSNLARYRSRVGKSLTVTALAVTELQAAQ